MARTRTAPPRTARASSPRTGRSRAKAAAIPRTSKPLAIAPAARARLRAGAERFDRGEYYEAHEAWEGLWLDEQRAFRAFYQGLVHYTAGYHHLLVKRNPRGVAVQFGSAAQKLAPYAPEFLGVDVQAIIADARLRAAATTETPVDFVAPRFPWSSHRTRR